MDAAGGRRHAAHTAPGQVGRKTGHRERFGRDFGTGGAENGTPGEVRQGFRDRWGGKRDTGRGLERVQRGNIFGEGRGGG